MADFHPVRVMASTETLHDKVSARALAEVSDLRDRILRGEVTEFVWAGLAPDESIVSSVGSTANAHMRLAAISRLLHRCNMDMDKDAYEPGI